MHFFLSLSLFFFVKRDNFLKPFESTGRDRMSGHVKVKESESYFLQTSDGAVK